jgi:hypothetical protein
MTFKTLALAVCIAAITVPAMADPGHGRGRGNSQGRGDDGVQVVRVHNQGNSRVIIADDDRGRIRQFLDQHYRGNCPPGLAKKHNGCLPPGQAKKHYVGEVLVVERPRTIWQALADLISPPPAGYHYVRADRDVLLVDTGNRVVDVVSVD